MRLALSLGRRGLGNTWPNPAVGCVIVKDGVIVGRGWTQAGGRPHAETEALRRAKRAAKGATLYATLEPCSHEGKTPPCADAIIKAGIARVVSAIEDPNPEVAGQGHARLRDNGIAVDVGLCADAARRAHAGHIARIATGRPHLTLKLAVSADGKAGLAGRKQVFITGDAARERVFGIRAQHDAILVGLGTILADNPQLTVRLPGLYERSPVRVVLDAQLRVPLSLSVDLDLPRSCRPGCSARTKASPMAEEILVAKGARVFRVDDTQGRLDLDEIMKVLGEQGITRLMVEGGPTVAAAFAAADLVDEFVLLRGPKEIGDGIGPLEGMELDRLTGGMTLDSAESLGADMLEHYVRS